MPASLIIIAALTCFILWFRCLLLSIALECDLQWQVLEVRRQPSITQLQLVEAETCCGLSLKSSYTFLRKVLPYFKQLGGDRPGPSCPILPRLTCPSPPTLFLALLSVKSPQPKPSLSIPSEFFFSSLNWVIGCAKEGPGATGMLCHRQPSASCCPRKAFQCYYHVPSFCHIKDSLTREIHFL